MVNGRAIGLIFVLPWAYFLVRGHLTGPWRWRTAIAFILGGLQGALEIQRRQPACHRILAVRAAIHAGDGFGEILTT